MRLFYSDAFNMAARSTTDGDSTVLSGSLAMGDADPEETACRDQLAQRYINVRRGLRRGAVWCSLTLAVCFLKVEEFLISYST